MVICYSVKAQQLWAASGHTASEVSGDCLHRVRLNQVGSLCRTGTAHASKLKLPVLLQMYTSEELSCVKLCREPLNLCKNSYHILVKRLHDNFKCSSICEWKFINMSLFFLYRPVFKDNQGNVDRDSRFSPLFRQESNKISMEDLIKLIAEYRR